jgi:protein phosphatase
VAKPALLVEAAGLTDVGLVREGNEDALVLHEAEALYVVADGMGGHSAGEVASAFTIEALRAFYDNADLTRRVRSAWRRAKTAGDASVDVASDALRLRKAVESANITVYRLAQQHEQLRDMGTTVVAVTFVGRKVYIANVGDSRVYRLRKGRIEQLTEDHSLLNEYIKMNLLSAEEVEAFPYKNVIVRALGLQESVIVDIFAYDARKGDQILLCSDGLTDLVHDLELKRVLADAPTAQSACYRLTELAKDRGGHDNITCIVARLHDPKNPPKPPIPPPPGDVNLGGAVGLPPPPAGPAPVSLPPPPPGPAPVAVPAATKKPASKPTGKAKK